MRASFESIMRKLRHRLSGSDGFGLMELIIAMFLLTVAISAMLSLYVGTAASMQRAGQKGTALTLAEKQMETYRTVPFTAICVDSATIPTGSDPYVTAHAGDATIPASTGQAVSGSNGDTGCPSSASYTTTGPDHRSYRVDTYVEYVGTDATFSHLTPASGLGLKRVTVITRDGAGTGTIIARASSTFVRSS